MSTTQPGGLGRLHASDDRDHLLRRTLLAGVPVERRNVRHASFFRKYDQGRTGTCVGHATKALTLVAPVISTKRDGPPTPYDLYDYAIGVDEWTGNDNDTQRQQGTSVRAGMKALQRFGLLSAYAFAFTIDDFVDGCMASAIVLGVNWYEHWFAVDDRTGLLPPIGAQRIAGGHSILCDQIDWVRGLAFGPNSWGYAFGRLNRDGTRNGRWGMPLETIEALLKQDGEAATSVETRVAAQI